MLVAAAHELMQGEGDLTGIRCTPGNNAIEPDGIVGNGADFHQLGFDDVRISHSNSSMAHVGAMEPSPCPTRMPSACPEPHVYALALCICRAFAQRFFVAAMIRARPSGLRRRFFLAAFAGAGAAVASALAFRAAAHRFVCAAAMRLRAAGLKMRLGRDHGKSGRRAAESLDLLKLPAGGATQFCFSRGRCRRPVPAPAARCRRPRLPASGRR